MLTRWLESAEVRRWWGDPTDRVEQVRDTPDGSHSIIAADGKPVGYIRWQAPSREELEAAGLENIPDGAIDIDLFVGEAEWRHRGLGSEALGVLVDRLKETTSAPAAGLCTSVENHAAHRAFAKAGFTIFTRFDDPTFGPCYVFLKQLRP